MAITGGTVESLDEIPVHVWKGLPDCLNLGHSAVNQSRIGVWATDVIPKGKRFGPFVGEKKKRSQVTSNVYMWEVYFPARGWMCIDATDPMKGNWLRYVNWARSSEEQNLFPLEINRAIYYKVLRPIGPGEELLVWYTVEDNPEITAALEEERASSLSRKNSPRAKRARRKQLEKARRAGLGGFKKTSGTKPTVKEMWDGEEGMKEGNERPSETSQEPSEDHSLGSTEHKDVQGMSAAMMDSENWGQEEGNQEEEEEEDGVDRQEMHHQASQQLTAADSVQNKQSHPLLTSGEESQKESEVMHEYSLLAGQDQEVDPCLDPDGELDDDPQGESYPCHHCERHFSTRQGLERHIHIHAISNQQTQLFKCRYCNKSFGSQVGRRRHERRHESGFKKRPGSLAGASSLLSPVMQTNSSPDCISPTSHYIAIGSQFTTGHVQNSEMQKKELGPPADRPLTLDENGESKELHPCKYCNKAFGTHTNMRRHQRRIHERHLLPKGVRRKGMLLQEATVRQQTGESPSTSPPPVYVPSADTEDEADRDDYAVDISKNISENLSFYIDGKIVSTSAVSSCEVIEVDSRSAALFGLDTVILSPNQISQALKAEGRTSAAKQITSSGQPAAKRRTSTPPLVTGLKVERETTSSPSSSTSSSSNLLVGGVFQQATDSVAFQREKTVYLSPKLKQLLQTQDFQKSTIALITESHRLASPLSVSALQGPSGKFKRRTASPPSSPQLSPTGKTESCKADAVSAHTLKVPKLESHSVPPPESLLDKDEGDSLSLSEDAMHSPASSSSGGNSCNQQPLDLSNSSVSRQSDNLSTVLGDAALDLSLHRKTPVEPEVKGTAAPQPLVKKRKPNTSMLEKVLMNEYVGLTLPGEEGPSALTNISSLSSRSPNVTSESAHPSPPSLTPVTMNPSSPGTCSVTSPTPPPPVLPTIPSPPALPGSPLSQPSDSPALRPLPVLSPKMSPRSVGHEQISDLGEEVLAAENKNEDDNHIAEPLDYPNTLLEDPPNRSATSSPPGPSSVSLPTRDDDVSLPAAVQNSNLNHSNAETEKLKSDFAALPSLPVLSSSSASHPPTSGESPASQISQFPALIKVKEEPQHCEDELPVTNHTAQEDVASAPLPADPDQQPEKASEEEEFDSVYCKTFVCNVCEEPFNSIKELSGHITEHVADWPFKCEFCVQLFGDAPALLTHRTSLHGVGQIFVCSVCSKEFAFLCNLQQHQKDLHPNETCSHTTVESGKLRPQNYTDPSRAKEESSPSTPAPEMADGTPQSDTHVAKEEPDVNGNHAEDPNEELYTTIKIMASEGGKLKGPDVRLGINQHYPSYKPPPFPYHSRSHAGSVASATNFTTHNIPQTFSTAIRCTKCGNSFDNMPELHKHILACANASDKKRYTPKKNPIPLKQIVKSPNGVASPTAATAGQGAFRRMGQPKRLNFNQETGKMKMSALSKKKNQLVQKAISQKNKAATTAKKSAVKVEEEHPSNVCPHCSREFTYTASLTKHMAISCPMKPTVNKKVKKGLAEVKKEGTTVADKSTGRKKASDSDGQTEPAAKPLGKTRARSSGAADAESFHPGKVKNAATVGRMKRPASFTTPFSASKKNKKAQVQSLPPTPSALDTPSGKTQRPAMRMQRMGKEPGPKKLAEAKSPPQLKKEERFALRTRERVGGPVTRSLQMASTSPPAEVKTEEPPMQEPKDSQEVLMK